jgi:8-oxo-dGTP diphosphatase
MQNATLCFLVQGDPPTHVLLGLKKIGFGAGKYAGFGGKVEPHETIRRAAARELQEETGVRVSERDLGRAAQLTFQFPAKPAWSQTVHVFLLSRWQGSPSESAEMKPAWFAVDNLPFDQMWQDGAHWLPRILAGEKLRAHYTFKDDNESIKEIETETLD